MFTILGVPPGNYVLCAQDVGGTFLDPCAWSGTLVQVTVGAAQVQSGIPVLLKKGASVTVRINDPSAVVAAYEKQRTGNHFTLAIGGARGIVLSPPAVPDSLGRSYKLLVPFNTPMKIYVHSQIFSLTDPIGTAMGPYARAIPVNIPVASPPQTIAVQVTGLL